MVSETLLANRQDTYRGPDLKLYVRDVRDAPGKKRSFIVRSWAHVRDAKEAIGKLMHVSVNAQRLYFGPLLSSGKELPNDWSLEASGIHRSGETLILEICSKSDGGFSSMRSKRNANHVAVSSSLITSTPVPLRETIIRARQAFDYGIKPELVMDGSGGSYYIHDTKKNKIAVFKPADEEPYAENNPRGYLPGQGSADSLRDGIAPGEACIREVAAFLLDHEGFSDVPMTTLAEASHPAFNTNGARLKVAEGGASIGAHSISGSSNQCPKGSNVNKVGSFQEFIRAEGSMDDLSPSRLSVDQVHKIAILDIRLLNADRNPANLLCRRLPDNTMELIPIDHGYCLRSMCDVSWMDWCWLDWPQMKQPLSEKSKQYIRKLNIESDARILRERLNITEQAVDFFRTSSSILKAGVEADLSLYDIAVMCCRNDNLAEKPSTLEHLTSMASELSQVVVVSEDWHHATACRALEEQLTPKSVVVSRDRSSGRTFRRCASSGEFLSVTDADVADDDDDDDFFFDTKMETLEVTVPSGLSKALGESDMQPPPLAHSSGSGSDSSSDNGKEVEKEEVDQWAHNIIEDSFQPEFPDPLSTRGPRSGSLSSEEGSLSSSPKGFWHVRPGFSSAATAAIMSDDDSASVQSFGTTPNSEEPSPIMTANRRASVTFADPPPRSPFSPPQGHFFRLPKTVSVVDQQEQDAVAAVKQTLGKESKGILISRQESNASNNSGMIRSKSYSALSRSFSSVGKGPSSKVPLSVSSSKKKRSESIDGSDEDLARTYFHKFMDLVIVREMARQSSVRT